MKKFAATLLLALIFAQGCASIHHGHDTLKLEAQYPSVYGESVQNFPVKKGLLEKELFDQLKRTELFTQEEKNLGSEEFTLKSVKYPGLTIEVEFQDPKLALLERDYMSSILSWLFTAVLTFWIHTDLYQLSYTAAIKITHRETQKVLFQQELPVAYSDYLNFHERSQGVLPYFFAFVVPPAFLPTYSEEVLYNLVPPAVAEVVRTIRSAVRVIRSTNPLLSKSPHYPKKKKN